VPSLRPEQRIVTVAPPEPSAADRGVERAEDPGETARQGRFGRRRGARAEQAGGKFAADVAGDLARADLRGAQADPAAFLGDVEREVFDEAAATPVVRDGSRTPQASAVQAQAGRRDFAGEQPGGVQRDLRAGRGEDLAGQSFERDRDVVRREREVGQDPQAARAEVDALFGEPVGDGFGDEVGQPDRAVVVGEPGESELDRKEEQQAGVRQPAQEATQR
jgi:hypothetical protein